MDRIAAARARLARAIDLPCILDAAYGAFDGMLPVIHHQQDPAGAAFTAFVMAAAYAANGRDAIGRAPSLPPATPRYQHDEQHTAVTAREAATALTELSQLLTRRLADAAELAAGSLDEAPCVEGARQAGRLWSVLSGAAGP